MRVAAARFSAAKVIFCGRTCPNPIGPEKLGFAAARTFDLAQAARAARGHCFNGGQVRTWSKKTMKMSLRTVAIATSSFACAALLSFSWSPETGVSASVESAQARVGRPGTPVSVAGVARRQNRRAVGYGVAAAAATGAVAATATGWGWNQPYYGGAQPWGYSVYGPGGYWGPSGPVAPVGPGWGVGNRPWTYGVYGPGGSYAPTPVAPVAPGWGAAAQPYQASVYGQGGPYTDAPGTCYRDCDNYRKALIESGYNPKNYRSAAGTVKQTNY